MLLEDDENLNRGIALKLQKEGYQVFSAFQISEAEKLFDENRIDLVISDITLPDGNGLEFCRKIRNKSKVFVLFLTAMDSEIDMVNGYDAGADDYITKPFSLMVLVSKVQAFMRRMEGVCGHNRILSGNIEVNYGEMRALKRNADGVTPLTLSKKELQIMIYFMENARQILSKEQILEYVWDVDGQFVDDNTVPVNISRLKGKIGNDYMDGIYMDRRKRTGVALAAGLLFLFVTEILLLFLAGNSLYKEEQGKLGALVLSHPEQETEYIELFDRGKQRNRQEEEAGKELEERYGYTPFDGRSVKTFAAYGIGMAMVFVAGLGVSWVLFLRNKRDRQQDENNQEELREKYIELQNHFEKVREKLSREENNTKSLITDISHQLKTPIASLKMSCELAGSADLTWEEREEFYKKEWDEIQRLENLLDSLIHVSRLESGMIQIQPEMGSLKNTLVQAVNSVYMKAYEKSIDISLDEFQDVQIVHDSKWTGEVFVNILDNAVKYSPEHTEIRIRVTELATCMMLEFIDQGTGIPAEEAHRVFQRFYRGNQEYVKKQEGSGVGLYLARKILEEQKGTICVKVAPEGGNNFVVTLPKK